DLAQSARNTRRVLVVYVECIQGWQYHAREAAAAQRRKRQDFFGHAQRESAEADSSAGQHRPGRGRLRQQHSRLRLSLRSDNRRRCGWLHLQLEHQESESGTVQPGSHCRIRQGVRVLGVVRRAVTAEPVLSGADMRQLLQKLVSVLIVSAIAHPAWAAKCQDIPLRVTIYTQAYVESTATFVHSDILHDARGEYIYGANASDTIKVLSRTHEAVLHRREP